MEFFKNDFIDEYVTEIKEHIDTINSAVISLRTAQKNIPLIKEILRRLHTIKGASRMLAFSSIEKLSHAMEDVFKGILEEKYEFTNNIAKLTFNINDTIEVILQQIKKTGIENTDITACLETCKLAFSGYFFNPDNLKREDKTNILQEEDDIEFGINDSFDNISSVRIDLDTINSIIHSFDNLIIRQFRLKHQIEQFEKNINMEVPKQIKEELSGSEDAVFETQKQIFILRMLPIEMILAPLRKEIETTALSLGKNIIVDVPKTKFMVDKIILEQLRTVILHIVRNSIDHGIETEIERQYQNKPAAGTISITIFQRSNKIIIQISDDGRGIQYESIREKAIQLNPTKTHEIEAMSKKDLQQFLYSAGFSTSKVQTDLSGRGMGLEIVRRSMEKIKGKIRIESEENKGTTFELTIPLSLATQRGLFVYAGKTKVMIPSHYVVEIISATEDQIKTVQSQTYISINDRLTPLYYLSSLLETEKPKNTTSVIILDYLETQIAMVVDSIQQNENVIVNPMPPILSKIKSLQGVVYDENYAIIPILDIPNLMQHMRELVAYDVKKYETKNRKKDYKILIVDDSVTTRQIEQTIFESEGYIVDTATDGVEALEKLKHVHFDAVITDVSMPRMDGMILLSNIRLMEEYKKTPVIIVSGAYDPDEKKKFIDSGAQAFIVKSEFQRGNLLQAVKDLLGED